MVKDLYRNSDHISAPEQTGEVFVQDATLYPYHPHHYVLEWIINPSTLGQATPQCRPTNMASVKAQLRQALNWLAPAC
jgi:hypothetical protein